MKKLIFLLLILFACQKEYCYTCNTKITTTTTGTGYASDTQSIYSSTNHCSITDSEARKIEKGMTSTATVKSGNITATTQSSCTCIRQ